MSRDIILPGGDKLQLFDSRYTGQQVEDILTKALRQANPNLLDNWYFIGGGSQQGGGRFPVNQRGKTEYTESGYTIDRWFIGVNGGNTKLDILEDCIRVTKLIAIYNPPCPQQVFENYKFKAGTTLTLSILARGNATTRLTFGFKSAGEKFYDYTPTSTINWGLYSFTYTLTVDDILSFVNIGQLMLSNAVGNYLEISAAKLEEGSNQTLSHQDDDGNWVLNDPPPNFALELEKCQRYQIPFRYANSDLRVRASVLNGTDYLFFMVPVPTSLRGRPTIENADDLAVTTIKNEFQSGFIFNVQGYGPGYVMIIAYKQNHGLNDGCLLSWKSPNPPLFNSNL